MFFFSLTEAETVSLSFFSAYVAKILTCPVLFTPCEQGVSQRSGFSLLVSPSKDKPSVSL